MTTTSIFPESAFAFPLTAVSFPKLGKKAESLSVKELKTELGKRGQPIDGTKKGDFRYLTFSIITFYHFAFDPFVAIQN